MKAMPWVGVDGLVQGHMIHCPACGYGHLFDTRWTFNGDKDRPTFQPSMLVNAEVNKIDPTAIRCHSFVTDGKIAFCSDSTHPLAGRTVDLPEIP